MNETARHQLSQQDRLDAQAERESQERGWSLPRCNYPNFQREYREFYGHDLDLTGLTTNDGSDPAVWALMEQFDRDKEARDSAGKDVA